MVSSGPETLAALLERWLAGQRNVVSAVMFGSQARTPTQHAAADKWSDVDLHLVVRDPREFSSIDWAATFPSLHFCLSVVRPATGGVTKLTVVFEEGEADLVLVPRGQMALVRLALRLGIARRIRPMAAALDVMATIMSGGYRFLKGTEDWGKVYERVAGMAGVRLNDEEITRLALVFLCEFHWVLQKIERGELVAAQRILHRVLLETNVVLLHELRLRDGQPTFQQARRVEKLVTASELKTVQVDARLDVVALRQAARESYAGLHYLMQRLVPTWHPPEAMLRLINSVS